MLDTDAFVLDRIFYNKRSIYKMPKVVDHEQYRKQLLQQSFELFAEIGYGNITMRQLAQKLEVSTGTLYHYFPSKEAMFLQLVKEQTQQDITNFLTKASVIPADIRSRVKAILNFVKEDREYFAKQMIISLNYCQQHWGKDNQSVSIFEKTDLELIQAVNDYLDINNLAMSELILTFINGLIFNQIYQSNFTAWEEQTDLFAAMIADISVK